MSAPMLVDDRGYIDPDEHIVTVRVRYARSASGAFEVRAVCSCGVQLYADLDNLRMHIFRHLTGGER
jgi:hypothetical protein